jgi:GNAT superfamily N-acetyltransferase
MTSPSTSEFYIRRMTKEDLKTPDRWATHVSSIERDFRNERTLGFVAVQNEKIIGYVGLELIAQDPDFSSREIPEIVELFVFKDYRNQGVGRALIHACEDHARTEGWTVIGLCVSQDPNEAAAQHLYTKLGYHPIEGLDNPWISLRKHLE